MPKCMSAAPIKSHASCGVNNGMRVAAVDVDRSAPARTHKRIHIGRFIISPVRRMRAYVESGKPYAALETFARS